MPLRRRLRTADLSRVDELAALQLQELHRLAEIGRLSASLLHQISNPLTAALLHLEQSKNHLPDSVRHVRRNVRLLWRYVEAARQQLRQESQPVLFSVGQQLEQVKRLVTPPADKARVSLVFDKASGYKLYGDPVKFQHVLANLLMNAIEAYDEDRYHGLARPVRVVVKRQRRYLVIRVIDWGKGITTDQMVKLFKPFYTTKKDAGYGLGIGLAMVEQYARHDFHGSITVTSSRRHGTQFSLRLPLPNP